MHTLTSHNASETHSFGTRARSAQALWLAEINHHEARVFRSALRGAEPQLIRPDQTDESIRHTFSFDGFSRGQEKPEPHHFFRAIAGALQNAGEILVFGSGHGTANEAEQFVEWLKSFQPELARRIVGTLVIDAHHTTDAQLLAKAREFHASPRLPVE